MGGPVYRVSLEWPGGQAGCVGGLVATACTAVSPRVSSPPGPPQHGRKPDPEVGSAGF